MASNAAVAALLKPTAQHGRNMFPLDNKHVYSMKAGAITPVKCFHYEPGTHFDMSAHDFTLTFPMQTAPFLRGRKEFSFYSVYYNAVWSLFNQYQATRNDPKSSAFGQSPTLAEPRIALRTLYNMIIPQWVGYLFYQVYIPYWRRCVFTPSFTNESEYDVDIYTRKAQEYFLNVTAQNFSAYFTEGQTSSGTPTEYTLTIENPLRVMDFPNMVGYMPDSIVITNGQWLCDINGHFRVYNWVRKLDMLGYGNLYPLLSHYESQFISACEESINSEVSSDAKVALILNYFNSIVRGLEEKVLQSCCTYDTSYPQMGTITDKYVNLYPICAYNSCFYHFFRNSYYDLDYYTHDYNLDFVSVDTSHGASNICTGEDFSLRFLDIEYHQWKKDTFTGVLPDTQFGAVSSIEIDLSGSVNVSGTTGTDQGMHINDGSLTGLQSSSIYYASPSSGTVIVGDNNRNDRHSHSFTGSASLNNTSFDVIALKRAEMLQEYRQTLMRAGNKTSDVFKAIYGSSVSSEHEDDVIPRFLETFGEDLFVDPVTATADTGTDNDNGSLGSLASRGKFRGDSKSIKFNAGGNFGLIICLTYVVPTAEYNSYMFDKHIFELSPELHYIPQLENYGLEPIYSDELNSLANAHNISVLGYGPRYYHKKSEVDVVHGAFCSLPDLTNFDKQVGSSFPFTQDWYGEFNNWVTPRTDMQNRVVSQVKDFYINPSVLDNIFVRAAGADFSDDQFICNTYFEVKATKMMSKIGLINFV